METTTKYPNLTLGYVLAIGSFVLSFASGMAQAGVGQDTPLSSALMVFAMLVGIGAFIYWLVCVKRFHDLLQKATQGGYPITPGRSMWYQLIPFFNIFWMFKWPNELAEFLNQVKGSKVMDKNTSGWIFLLGGVIGRFAGPAGFVIDFLVLGKLIKNTKETLRGVTLPVAYSKEKYKTSLIWLLIVIPVMIIGLLAAIAVPNFIMARDRAKARIAENQKVLEENQRAEAEYQAEKTENS